MRQRKKEIQEIQEIEILWAYYNLIKYRSYDFESAMKHIQENLNVKVEDYKKVFSDPKIGCCLHHSVAWLVELLKLGIEAYLAGSPEEDGATHACVYWKFNGKWYISDIVEDVKKGTVENIMLNPEDFRKKQIGEKWWLYKFKKEDAGELFFKKMSDSIVEL